MKKNEILIHLHMPKTGGTTLKRIINKNIPPGGLNYDIYAESEQRKIKLRNLSSKRVYSIQGHFPFGVHQYFQEPSIYITMLREPIERIISEYYYIRSMPSHNQYHQVKNLNLGEYQQQLGKINLQTRLISGQGTPVIIAHLEEAKKNIEKHFSVVGITEMYNESIFLMKKTLGWKRIHYKKLNVTKEKPAIDNLPEKTIDLIKENNQIDIELYQFAKKLLIKKINNLDSLSKKELNTFLKRN
jgi:hypothetical protein